MAAYNRSASKALSTGTEKVLHFNLHRMMQLPGLSSSTVCSSRCETILQPIFLLHHLRRSPMDATARGPLLKQQARGQIAVQLRSTPFRCDTLSQVDHQPFLFCSSSSWPWKCLLSPPMWRMICSLNAVAAKALSRTLSVLRALVMLACGLAALLLPPPSAARADMQSTTGRSGGMTQQILERRSSSSWASTSAGMGSGHLDCHESRQPCQPASSRKRVSQLCVGMQHLGGHCTCQQHLSLQGGERELAQHQELPTGGSADSPAPSGAVAAPATMPSSSLAASIPGNTSIPSAPSCCSSASPSHPLRHTLPSNNLIAKTAEAAVPSPTASDNGSPIAMPAGSDAASSNPIAMIAEATLPSSSSSEGLAGLIPSPAPVDSSASPQVRIPLRGTHLQAC